MITRKQLYDITIKNIKLEIQQLQKLKKPEKANARQEAKNSESRGALWHSNSNLLDVNQLDAIIKIQNKIITQVINEKGKRK